MATALRLIIVALAFAAGCALASPAPEFTVPDATGKPVRLADYRGRFVVLEWTNPDCPFVRAQYGAEAMQGLQKEWSARDVVWLSINSTNRSSGEYKSGAQMSAWMSGQGGTPRAILIDSDSATGRAYGAKTTPHMFVIDPAGSIVYSGAIDDRRSARASEHKDANNYVRAALTEATAGKAVSVSSTTPYGCSVKY